MKPEEFLDIVYKESDRDYGICPPPISADKGLNILIEHFLGKDWYVIDPLGQDQIYTVAIYDILEKYKGKKNDYKRNQCH
jgi:hypothetical protein